MAKNIAAGDSENPLDLTLWPDGFSRPVAPPSGVNSELYDPDVLAPTYRGAFVQNNGAHGFTGVINPERRYIGPGTDPQKMFVSPRFDAGGRQWIGEFTIPAPSLSLTVAELPVNDVVQNYVNLISKFGNTPSDAMILGTHITASGRMLVGVRSYYNTPYDLYNTGVIVDPSNLAGSAAHGLLRAGNQYRAVGYIGPIQSDIRSLFGGADMFAGNGLGNYPINGSRSTGPNMWVGSETDFNGTPATDITMDGALDYPFVSGQMLHNLDSSSSHNNSDSLYTSDLWNYMTEIACVFLIPGTFTLMAIGNGWGKLHMSDPPSPANGNYIIYKGLNVDGVTQPGYAYYYPDDAVVKYMLWDVREIAAAFNSGGSIAPYSVAPYKVGNWPIPVPFYNYGTGRRLTGGFYQPSTGILRLNIRNAASAVSANASVIVEFQLGVVA